MIKKNDIVGYGKGQPYTRAGGFAHYGVVTGLIAAGTHPPSHVLVLELVTDVCLRKPAGYGDPGEYTWKFQKVIWPIPSLEVVDHINDLVLLEKIYE